MDVLFTMIPFQSIEFKQNFLNNGLWNRSSTLQNVRTKQDLIREKKTNGSFDLVTNETEDSWHKLQTAKETISLKV